MVVIATIVRLSLRLSSRRQLTTPEAYALRTTPSSLTYALPEAIPTLGVSEVPVEPPLAPPPPVVVVPPPPPRDAYVTIISNEEYVDGALVLGWSLTRVSELVAAGKVDLAILVPPGLSATSIARLRAAGWGTVVPTSPDLSQPRPPPKWRRTFNKLYVFNLTQYRKVVFWDADVLCHGSPDDILATTIPDSPPMIGAIGSPGDTYFKTGNMVLRPSAAVFGRLLELIPQFNTPHGRDGALLRHFFNGSFRPIAPTWSQYRRPHSSLKGQRCFHFRGEYKPWQSVPLDAGTGAFARDFIEFGPAHRLWWEAYASMHAALEPPDPPAGWGEGARREPRAGGADAVGDDDAAAREGEPPPSPRTHFWMMRGTRSAYLRPIWAPSGLGEVVEVESGAWGSATAGCSRPCVAAHSLCAVDFCSTAVEWRGAAAPAISSMCRYPPPRVAGQPQIKGEGKATPGVEYAAPGGPEKWVRCSWRLAGAASAAAVRLGGEDLE